MAKKVVRRNHKKAVTKRHTRKQAHEPEMLVVVRGWMFIVAFALMLGIGAIVGTYFNTLLNESAPIVAGASIIR